MRLSPLTCRPFLIITLAMGLSSLLMMSTGCQSTNRHESWQITTRDLRRDMSPSLKTLTQTREQHATSKARVTDLNLRMIHDDMDLLLLQDRPSYLTRYPVP